MEEMKHKLLTFEYLIEQAGEWGTGFYAKGRYGLGHEVQNSMK